MPPTALERFMTLVRRELDADDVRLLDLAAASPTADNVLCVRLPDGRQLAVVFASAPASRDALQRRLDMLVKTFAQSIEDDASGPRGSRPPVTRSLTDELRAVAKRVGAVDAFIIDANSPIVWGSAAGASAHDDLIQVPNPDDPVPLVAVSTSQLVESPDDDDDRHGEGAQDVAAPPESGTSSPPPAPRMRERVEQNLKESVARDAGVPAVSRGEASRVAAKEVRSLAAIQSLHKGGHLHHVVSGEDFGYVAQSFAAIYVVVLVFDVQLDELRAERALNEALPRIERLVMALPPLDPRPAPMAGVISLRARRRR